MSGEIKPALTPSEWRDHEIESHYGIAATSLEVDHNGRIFTTATMPGEETVVVVLNEYHHPEVLQKVAALCLYGQPFGFTQADAAHLRQLATEFDDEADVSVGHGEADIERRGVWGKNAESCRHRACELRRIADRITALLPPPTSEP